MLKDSELKTLPDGRHKDGARYPHLFFYVRGESRSWLMRYKLTGSPRVDLSLGAYPAVSLKAARLEAVKLNLEIAQGRCPKTCRKDEKQRRERESITFKDVAATFVKERIASSRNLKAQYRWGLLFDKYIYPAIGEMKLADITLDDIYGILDPIWTTKYPTAQRVQQNIKSVIDYATARGLYEKSNPADMAIIKHGLSKVRYKETPHSSLHYENTRPLYRKLCDVHYRSAYALRWLILSGSRTCEVLRATWPEINHELRVWEIPAEHMKTEEAFAVPLTGEHFRILEDMEPFRKPGGRIFELSDASMRQRLRKVGVGKDQGDVHGFRSTLKTWALEQGYAENVADALLAHKQGSTVARTYNRTSLPEFRREAMEEWNTYLTTVDQHLSVVG